MYPKIKLMAIEKNRNLLRMRLLIFAFLFSIHFFIPGIPAQAQETPDTSHKPLMYEIDVNAQIIPVFAVDNNGEPVFDLKTKEIQLRVNGKPCKIAHFAIFQVEMTEDTQQTIKGLGRINFIVFDSVSNSRNGLKRAKEIALGIIKESPPTDAFVILESNPNSGIRYVAGPERERKKLSRAIKEVVTIAGQRYFSPHKLLRAAGASRGGIPQGNQKFGESSRDYNERMFAIAMQHVQSEKMEYQEQIKVFLHSLTQLKYALKTITQPRLVFLISGGIPTVSLGANVVRYYRFMGTTAKAINYGGSVLYMINPVMAYNTSITNSLKFMAEESGGKYFGGTDIKKVVTRVKKNTRAYYELAFFPGKPDPNKKKTDKLKIKLNCKRKGVTVNTVNYSERGKPYRDMETIQKKLFALSVATGGSWSRIVGNVKKVKFKKRKSAKEPAHIGISLPIPEAMRRQVDIFVVNLEPDTMKAEIGISHQTLNEKLKMEVPVVEGKDQYVVIVEPRETRCLFNKVK